MYHSALDISQDSITSVIVDPADVTSVLKYSVTFWKFKFHHLRTFNCDHNRTFYIKPLESPTPPESLKVPIYICVSYVKAKYYFKTLAETLILTVAFNSS